MWERQPDEWGTGVTALLYGIAIRDQFPERFFDFHLAAFAARHDHGKKLGHEDVVREAVASAGLDVDAVAEEAWSGRPLKTLAAEHTERSTGSTRSASRRSSRATRPCSSGSWSATGSTTSSGRSSCSTGPA